MCKQTLAICGISVVFQGHVCCWYIYGCSIVDKSCSLLFLWDLHVNYIICHLTKNSHVAPHFNHLDLRNAMVPLMMLLASWYSSASTSGVTRPKSQVGLILIVTDQRNAVVSLMSSFVWHDTYVNTSVVTWPKSHAAPQLHSQLS